MIKKNSNTLRCRTGSKCETKYTCGLSLRIGANTKRLFGFENLQNTYQTT